MTYVFRSLTQPEVDQQYDVTASITDRESLIGRFEYLSERITRANTCELNVIYGAHIDERADLFFPSNMSEPAPVHVFIHGGYWYQFTKREWSFTAESLCARGAIVVVPTYSLCPKFSVPEILRQMQRFIVWLRSEVASFGGDPNRIFLSGHSAGGYMAAALLLTDWEGEYSIPNDSIKGVTTISALHDLEPLRHSYLQAKLNLTQPEVSLLTLTEQIKAYEGSAQLDCFVGGQETAEFIRQSHELSELWLASNHSGLCEVIENRNHLDILYELSDLGGRISNAVVAQMSL